MMAIEWYNCENCTPWVVGAFGTFEFSIVQINTKLFLQICLHLFDVRRPVILVMVLVVWFPATGSLHNLPCEFKSIQLLYIQRFSSLLLSAIIDQCWTSIFDQCWTSIFDQCWTSIIDQCWTSIFDQCWTSIFDQCWTSIFDQCWTSIIDQCWTSIFDQCWTSIIDQCWTSIFDQCWTLIHFHHNLFPHHNNFQYSAINVIIYNVTVTLF